MRLDLPPLPRECEQRYLPHHDEWIRGNRTYGLLRDFLSDLPGRVARRDSWNGVSIITHLLSQLPEQLDEDDRQYDGGLAVYETIWDSIQAQQGSSASDLETDLLPAIADGLRALRRDGVWENPSHPRNIIIRLIDYILQSRYTLESINRVTDDLRTSLIDTDVLRDVCRREGLVQYPRRIVDGSYGLQSHIGFSCGYQYRCALELNPDSTQVRRRRLAVNSVLDYKPFVFNAITRQETVCSTTWEWIGNSIMTFSHRFRHIENELLQAANSP